MKILNILLLILSLLSYSQGSEYVESKSEKVVSSPKYTNGITHRTIPESSTIYTTGQPYSNNMDELRVLAIPGVLSLGVTITGEVEENYDKIFITDIYGNETEYTGALNEDFMVDGDAITVRFISNGSVVKEGVTVSIREYTESPPPVTMYTTGQPYVNNTDDIQELMIYHTPALKVTINGEVEEDYDKIFITDSRGYTTEYTGALNEEFIVPGNRITVRFTSDGSVVKEGAIVYIERFYPDKITTYKTGHPYENNVNQAQGLFINNASALKVTISGEVEQNYDKIIITDSTGNITEYTGVLNEEFIVPGNRITVRFTSNGSIVKEGVVVHIEESGLSSESTYETAHQYANNTDETHELFVQDALSLRVTITGEVEQNYDKIFIIDSAGNETEYTGVLNENFIVEGNRITVRFTSDSSIVKEGVVVHIEANNTTTYETGHPYIDNTNEIKELSITDASFLKVTIIGEIEENYDKIFITDSAGNQTEYTGVLNENFILPGDHITVRFTSDGSIVKEGVLVHVENISAELAKH